jgi:Zn-dependent protease
MSGCSVQRWSLSLGRWAGVHVRVHIFFLLFAVLALAYSDVEMFGATLLILGIALVSLLLHEAAHAAAAIRLGGKVDTIILGPVGGLVSPRVPDEPEVQLFVALAGPMVHLTLAVIAAAALVASGFANIASLLNPLEPSLVNIVDNQAISWLMVGKLTLWLNWVLMLVNLLPAYPFDGGPILRSMLWPALGRRTAWVVTGQIGMIVAVLICAAAWLPYHAELNSTLYVRLPLMMLGIFLFFSARQDMASGWSEDLFHDDAGYNVRGDGVELLDPITLEDEDDEAVLVEHQSRQSESRDQRRRAQEAYEDARVDDILARLHDTSMSQLSREELEILQRASERYKQRLHSGDE